MKQDLLGKKYGMLTVVEYLGIIRRSAQWRCQCECGSMTNRSTGDLNRSLKEGKGTSCRKCAQRKNKTKSLGFSSWIVVYNNYKLASKRKNRAFELSLEEFKDLCQKPCHYCEAEPRDHNRYVRTDGTNVAKTSDFTANRSWIKTNGIDRKNNSIGYVLENCLPCCTSCNLMKGTLDYHDFIARCGTIYLVDKLKKGNS